MISWDIHKITIHDKWKKKWFETHPVEIAEYSWNYLFTGGKEIRCKLFCELWKYLAPDSEIVAELAFAVECIHVASLVLDDTPCMDNAVKRRGCDTLHVVFSPKKALLLANDIISIAVEIWLQNKPAHIDEQHWKSILITKLQRLAMGQWIDLAKTGTLVELASLKTGVLFELVTETVALCNHLDATFWRIWGNHIGILFQWVDDWIDRDEDIIQNNRNAFNEAFDTTFQNYIVIWKKVQKNIGIQWFNHPFGIFMKQYFVEQLHIEDDGNMIGSLRELFIHDTLWTTDDDKCKQYIGEIIIAECTNPAIKRYPYLENFFRELNHEVIIQRIFYLCDMLFEISTQTKLWSIEEDKWELYIESILPKLKTHQTPFNYYNHFEYYIQHIILPKMKDIYKYTGVNIHYTNIRSVLFTLSNSILETSPPTKIWMDDDERWKQYIQDVRKLIISELSYPI